MEEGKTFERNVDIFKHGLSFETQPQVKFIREPKIFHLALPPKCRPMILGPYTGGFCCGSRFGTLSFGHGACRNLPWVGDKISRPMFVKIFYEFSLCCTHAYEYVPQDSYLHGFVGLKIKFMTTCKS